MLIKTQDRIIDKTLQRFDVNNYSIFFFFFIATDRVHISDRLATRKKLLDTSLASQTAFLVYIVSTHVYVHTNPANRTSD